MSRIDQAELDDLKSRTLLSAVFEKYGVKSKGSRTARWAVCCFHAEKSGSLKINDQRGRYHCFGCGAAGDHFTVLTELGGKTFMEAVEVLGGVRLITAEERKVIEDRNNEWQAEERRVIERTRKSIQHTFTTGKPIGGTHVEAYLKARGLRAGKFWTFDLRFVADLTYRGFTTPEAEESVELGTFPAMVAAIRNPTGEIIGLHRTYLDLTEPRKLTPPGDPRRNKAKKVLGEQRGGYIRLSPDAPRLATGEGIETSRAWFAMGHGGEEEIAIGAAVSLGNLSGGAMGSTEHPADPTKRIPNGIPDMDRPGMLLPACVKQLIMLGDGDSDPAMTKARLLVAGRRYRAMGLGVGISMAPDGIDFADEMLAEGGDA